MKRKILVIIGSESDLLDKKTGISQMAAGLTCLSEFEKQGKVKSLGVQIASVHRHTKIVIGILDNISNQPENERPDIIIAGAGWAAALPGFIDGYLRNDLSNNTIQVIGVGFEDYENNQHSLAARLSISELPPGNGLIYADDKTGDTLTGNEGFLKACYMAATFDFPDIKLPKPRAAKRLTLAEALNATKP